MPPKPNSDSPAEYFNGAAPTAPTNEYIYAGSLKVASIQSGATNYWHNDHLSPRVRTDTSGNVSDQRGTFPFGETWYNASNDKLLFTTYERDSESTNDYAQARYHVSGLGRFSSPDPIAGSTSDPQSFNRYSYVRNMPVMLTDPFGTCPGGFAQIYDPHQDQSQDSKSSGPSNTDSDSDQIPQTGPPSWAVGPCPGFTDQGGGGGGTSGVSIDEGGGFNIADGTSGLLGSSDSTVACPNNVCNYVAKHTWTLDGDVVASYGQYMQFEAFADGNQNYFALYGPGALYGTLDAAGAAAGAFFLPESEATHREFGGLLTQDTEGFFSYNLNAVGPTCESSDLFCGISVPPGPGGLNSDLALWHTHVYEGAVGQFAGDRMTSFSVPNYVTTPIDGSQGAFTIGPKTDPSTLFPLNQFPPVTPQKPICRVSGASLAGIPSCH